ncbi:hypothetical protein GCM10027294_29680 [Marinactinospora endophytica]
MPLVNAQVTTSGTWGISAQHGSPSTVSFQIPQGGLEVQTSGLASCHAVTAPDGPASVAGDWTNGNPASTLVFAGDTVPVEVTGGFGCPTAATQGSFSATYQVRNVSTPSSPINITA